MVTSLSVGLWVGIRVSNPKHGGVARVMGPGT